MALAVPKRLLSIRPASAVGPPTAALGLVVPPSPPGVPGAVDAFLTGDPLTVAVAVVATTTAAVLGRAVWRHYHPHPGTGTALAFHQAVRQAFADFSLERPGAPIHRLRQLVADTHAAREWERYHSVCALLSVVAEAAQDRRTRAFAITRWERARYPRWGHVRPPREVRRGTLYAEAAAELATFSGKGRRVRYDFAVRLYKRAETEFEHGGDPVSAQKMRAAAAGIVSALATSYDVSAAVTDRPVWPVFTAEAYQHIGLSMDDSELPLPQRSFQYLLTLAHQYLINPGGPIPTTATGPATIPEMPGGLVLELLGHALVLPTQIVSDAAQRGAYAEWLRGHEEFGIYRRHVTGLRDHLSARLKIRADSIDIADIQVRLTTALHCLGQARSIAMAKGDDATVNRINAITKSWWEPWCRQLTMLQARTVWQHVGSTGDSTPELRMWLAAHYLITPEESERREQVEPRHQEKFDRAVLAEWLGRRLRNSGVHSQSTPILRAAIALYAEIERSSPLDFPPIAAGLQRLLVA